MRGFQRSPWRESWRNLTSGHGIWRGCPLIDVWSSVGGRFSGEKATGESKKATSCRQYLVRPVVERSEKMSAGVMRVVEGDLL